jgi:hypothetical protein
MDHPDVIAEYDEIMAAVGKAPFLSSCGKGAGR